jgi:hypothetical protein
VTNPQCIEDNDGGIGATVKLDAGAACPGYYAMPEQFNHGKVSIEVKAPGFNDESVDVDIPPSRGCCGPDLTERRSVTLTP